MNKVCLTGRITKNIELKYNQNNVAITSFTLAVTRKFKNQNGEYESDFINCIAYKSTAELLSKYTGKGDLIGIEGRIQTRNYEKDGKRIYVTEVIVDSIDFLQSKKDESKHETENTKQKLSDEVFSEFGSSIEIDESDIAF
jgi:single-stranded DNA-binding protein 3|nr:MAG TPA: Single strand binding protein [Caudoviricetes sp.]